MSGQTPPVHDHASGKWLSRTDGGVPKDTIEQAWERAVSVGGDDFYGEGRLYEPANVVIVARNGLIRTVLLAEGMELHTDHLVECEDCEQLWDKGATDTCHWCRDEQEPMLTVRGNA